MSWDLGSTGSRKRERMSVTADHCLHPTLLSKLSQNEMTPSTWVSPLFPLWEGPSKKIFFNSLPEHTNFERTRKKFLIFILLLCYTCLKISSCSKYISLEYHFSHSYISLSTFLLIFLRYDLFNSLTNTCMFIMCPNTFVYSSYKLFYHSIIVFTKGIWGHLMVFQSTASSPVYYDILNILCTVCMTASVSNVVTGTL